MKTSAALALAVGAVVLLAPTAHADQTTFITWSDKGRMSVERNSDIEHGGDGGIWMCVQNQKTDSTASLNLSDADAL